MLVKRRPVFPSFLVMNLIGFIQNVEISLMKDQKFIDRYTEQIPFRICRQHGFSSFLYMEFGLFEAAAI